MNIFETFEGVNLLVLTLALGVVLAATMEAAFLFGRRRADTVGQKGAGHIASLAGTQLAFLALLIGFTFSMALSRYSERKAILQREVNDLGTCYLRTDILAAPYAEEAKALLRQYVKIRVEDFAELNDDAREAEFTRRTDAVQERLWANAMSAIRAEKRLDAPITALYVNSLNQVLSDRSERAYSLVSNHLPEAIIWLLIAVAMLTVGLSGYSSGLHLRRSPIVRVVLIVSTVMAIVLIVDLDRPRRGVIRIDQSAMFELVDALGE